MPTAKSQNRIAEMRKKLGFSQAQLAAIVGAHWITISKLERGQMQLTASWLDRLAEALHVGPSDLLAPPTSLRTIEVEGIVQVGGGAVFYENPRPWGIEREDVYDADSIWMLVEGEALWPLFQDGDLLRLVQIEIDISVDHLGRLCAVVPRPSTPESSAIIGFLDNGSREGLFDIRPMNRPPVRDLEIEQIWIAVEARFRPSWMKKIAE